MALILCIETSTRVCSVGISGNGQTLTLAEDKSSRYAHAEQLNVLIKEVLEKSGKRFDELDAVAVSEGPGSYTGLRIGVSAAKGIAFAREIPILTVNPLHAMCSALIDQNPRTLLLPMIDARRMEVFTAGFDGRGLPVFPTRAEIVDSDSFPERKNFERTYFFGDGAEKTCSILADESTRFKAGVVASAEGMMPLAEKLFRSGQFADTAYFEPFYLKDFVAGKPKKRPVD